MGRPAGLFTFTACALGASAFLLPPSLSTSDFEAADIAALTGSSGAINAVVSLPCPECAFPDTLSTGKTDATEEESLFTIQGGAKSILVNFTVSEDGHRLDANGITICSFGRAPQQFSGSAVYASQVRTGASLADIEDGTERATQVELTGFGYTYPEVEGNTVFPVEFIINEIDGQPVTLDRITVTVMNGVFGLEILEISTIPAGHSWPVSLADSTFEDSSEDLFPFLNPEVEESALEIPEFDREEDCSTGAFCKLRNAIKAKLMELGMKGDCHGHKGAKPHKGKLPTHIRPHFRPDLDEHEEPHHHGHWYDAVPWLPHPAPPHHRPEKDEPEPPPPHPPHHRPGKDEPRPPPPHRPHHGPEMDEPEPPHHRPHHGHDRPHHPRPHHHGHHRHHFMHAFTRGLAAVLIPTIAGVAVGMIVSLVGLVFGRLIGFLWIRFYRGGRRGYASVALHEPAAEPVEIDGEALPVYESAPKYEDIVKEEK